MTQALYAHMNNKRKKKRISLFLRLSLFPLFLLPSPRKKVFPANIKLVYILRALELLISTQLD
jgi:hypothetical protein